MMEQIDVKERDAWVAALDALMAEVEGWAGARGWRTERERKEMKEHRLGVYEAPVLTVHSPRARVVLEPMARYAFESDGRVDVYAWPTFQRLMLKNIAGQWRLETESGVRWPRQWGAKAFEELADLLGEAA